MEKVLQSIIALSGLCAISSHVQCQYLLVSEPKTFSEALSYCREKYTNLVSVDNEGDMRLLNSMVDLNRIISSKNSDPAWIGMTYDVNSWRWSLSDSSFYKHGETEFRPWDRGEPNGPYSQRCVQLSWNRKWRDDHCHVPFLLVCSEVTGPNVTFVYIPTPMPWTKAQSYCRERHTDLASVRNMAEQKKLEEVVPGGRRVWLGLSKDLWKWSDGSQSSFRYWKDNPGNTNTKHCVAADFSNSGKWEKSTCDSKKASICYSTFSGHRQMVKVKLVKSNSSLDLNDPAVMEDILKQLKKNLKDQGVNKDVRLSWRKQADGKVFHREDEEGDKKRTAKDYL